MAQDIDKRIDKQNEKEAEQNEKIRHLLKEMITFCTYKSDNKNIVAAKAEIRTFLEYILLGNEEGEIFLSDFVPFLKIAKYEYTKYKLFIDFENFVVRLLAVKDTSERFEFIQLENLKKGFSLLKTALTYKVSSELCLSLEELEKESYDRYQYIINEYEAFYKDRNPAKARQDFNNAMLELCELYKIDAKEAFGKNGTLATKIQKYFLPNLKD
ncbi:hypothetical protein [Campylobacter sp. 19-13652]|uniref:hypothetical protein n=1 Tax=Campylobacter sp. 19-13652 TaxID=2840180 RepID=UPI001C77CB0C|nr:hypothetical protein [Campylobacter sp. 19-13652]BCX79949.1 hypothetical protein LBC_14110 [Campylobacter sp. 19-13652]